MLTFLRSRSVTTANSEYSTPVSNKQWHMYLIVGRSTFVFGSQPFPNPSGESAIHFLTSEMQSLQWLGYWFYDTGFDSWDRQVISVFSNTSWLVERTTRPHIKWKSGVKSPERKAELHLVTLRMNGAISLLPPYMPSKREDTTHTPILPTKLHGIIIRKTTLNISVAKKTSIYARLMFPVNTTQSTVQR